MSDIISFIASVVLFMSECPAKSQILNRIISVEHMLNKQAVSHCQCPGLGGYSCPNVRVHHQADKAQYDSFGDDRVRLL